MSDAFLMKRLALHDIWPDLSTTSRRAEELRALLYRTTQRKMEDRDLRDCLRDESCYFLCAIAEEGGSIVGIALVHKLATPLGVYAAITDRCCVREWASLVESPLTELALKTAQGFGAKSRRITFLC